jgi:GTP cyclohydrolase IA
MTDLERGTGAVRDLLRAVGADPDAPGLRASARRFAQAFAEMMSGIGVDAGEPLTHGETAPPGVGIVRLTDVDFRSVCAHHLVPFHGTASVSYAPGERVFGIGSIVRSLEILSARPQMQERLGQELADALVSRGGARGAAVSIVARHACLADRGPRQPRAELVSVATAGQPLPRGE